MKKTIFLAASILIFFCEIAVAQTIKTGIQKHTVTGTVLDAATSKPIPGANLEVPGVASAITDDNGHYSISIYNAEIIMNVSATGYNKREISIRGRSVIEILLNEENYKGASKTIHTPVGDQSVTKSVYSWFGIKEDNLAAISVTPDALLKTQASGLNVLTRSGTPASGSNFYLHGINTMNAGSMPLFVVDGMPYENTFYSYSLIGNYLSNPLSSIDPKDIESITVLKNGTSLFGTKGANGVVLIRTLRSNSLETRINAYVNTGIGFERSELPLLNNMEHKHLLAELYQKAIPDVSPATLNNTLPFLNQNVPVKQPWGYEGNIDYYRYNANTNWQNQVLAPSLKQNVYLNVAGGDEVATYVLSLGYLNHDGMVKNTGFSRFNTRFNSEIKFSQKFRVLANMSFMYATKHLPNEGGNIALNPILASLVKAPFTAPHIYNAEGRKSPNLEDADFWNLSNPYVLVNNKNNIVNINYRFFGSFEFIYNINSHIYMASQLGLNFHKEREKAFYPSTGVAFKQDEYTVDVLNESHHRVDRLFSLYSDTYINYKNTFNREHALNIRAGLRYQDNAANNNYGLAFNTSSDEFKSLQYGAATLRRVGGSINDWKWTSIYANLDYSFLNKYFFNVQSAFDASSRYGVNISKFQPFPSAGAAWLISNEKFLGDQNWINLLKVSANYGISGNDDIGNYNGARYYYPYALVGQFGLVRTSLVNTELKPERLERLGMAIDLSMHDERINLGLYLYSNTVNDMVLSVKPASISGSQSNIILNAGKMRNTGFDININTRIVNNEIIKWDLGLMVSNYTNKVLDLGGKEFYTDFLGATIQSKVGQSLGQFYGYKTNGVYATTADAANDGLSIREGLVLIPFGAGDMRFVNQNDDKVIDESDRVVIGNPNPDFFGNINSRLKYQNFELNATFFYSLGGDVYNYTRSQLESMSMPYNQLKTVVNRWRMEGDATSVPKATPGDRMGNARFSDRWIEDGSYMRLKNVTLSYNVDLKLPIIENCLIYITGENLLTFTRYKGLDPEFAAGANPLLMGIDPSVVPHARTISAGIKLGL